MLYNELSRRYRNIGSLFWVLFFTASICISVIWGYMAAQNNKMIQGSMLDAVYLSAQSFVFPTAALIVSIWQILTLKMDEDPQYVLQYGDKKKIWAWESRCFGLISVFCAFLLLLIASVAGWLICHRVDNWVMEDSFINSIMARTGETLILPSFMKLPLIYLIAFLTYFLLFYITFSFGAVLWWKIDSIILPILIIAACSIWDTIPINGFHFWFKRLNVRLYMFIHWQDSIKILLILLIIAIFLRLVGNRIAGKREYLSREESL